MPVSVLTSRMFFPPRNTIACDHWSIIHIEWIEKSDPESVYSSERNGDVSGGVFGVRCTTVKKYIVDVKCRAVKSKVDLVGYNVIQVQRRNFIPYFKGADKYSKQKCVPEELASPERVTI